MTASKSWPTLIAEIELPSLWRFALQITRDKHDAEDLVQRTCVRAIEQSDRYTTQVNLKAGCFGLLTISVEMNCVREQYVNVEI